MAATLWEQVRRRIYQFTDDSFYTALQAAGGGSVQEDQLVNLLVSDTTPQKQAKLDALPVSAAPGVKATIQWENGTHTETDVLKLRGIKYPVDVLGDATEFASADTKLVNVELKAPIGPDYGLLISDCSHVELKGIAFTLQAGANVATQMIRVCESHVKIIGCNMSQSVDAGATVSADSSVVYAVDCRLGGDFSVCDFYSEQGSSMAVEFVQDITGRSIGHFYAFITRQSHSFLFDSPISFLISESQTAAGEHTS